MTMTAGGIAHSHVALHAVPVVDMTLRTSLGPAGSGAVVVRVPFGGN